MRCTVLYLGFADIFNLHRILDCFEQDLRVALLNLLYSVRNIPVKRIIKPCRIDQHSFSCRNFPDILIDSIIWMQYYTVLCKLFLYLCIQLLLIDIQMHLIHCDDRIRENQREKLDIISAHIQRPAYIVQ